MLIDASSLSRPQANGEVLGDRRVRGCGVRATFSDGLVIEIVNLRVGDGLVLELSARQVAQATGIRPRVEATLSVSLQTSGENTARLLPAGFDVAPANVDAASLKADGVGGAAAATIGVDRSSEDGPKFVHRGTVDPDAGARLFQQLMIGGATVAVERTGGRDELNIPGPLPRTVRTGFLNCSGDLFPRTR
ncbi:MAG: hypothetical protein SH859_06335 [Hyphomicrobium aestuarii]|nr:hypothetical protein [Hyphomicrobium aestuarii]